MIRLGLCFAVAVKLSPFGMTPQEQLSQSMLNEPHIGFAVSQGVVRGVPLEARFEWIETEAGASRRSTGSIHRDNNGRWSMTFDPKSEDRFAGFQIILIPTDNQIIVIDHLKRRAQRYGLGLGGDGVESQHLVEPGAWYIEQAPGESGDLEAFASESEEAIRSILGFECHRLHSGPTLEAWVSDDLRQLMVQRVRSGRVLSEFRILEVAQAAPLPSVFEVPIGYVELDHRDQ